MPVTATEVEINFRPTPYNIFELGNAAGGVKLRFRIWPEAQIGLSLIGKKPGAGWNPQVDDLVFAFAAGIGHTPVRSADRCRPGRGMAFVALLLSD
jgi:glucose-6-phosphate 1-dehydrogenase